jgi:hypothetical protein
MVATFFDGWNLLQCLHVYVPGKSLLIVVESILLTGFSPIFYMTIKSSRFLNSGCFRIFDFSIYMLTNIPSF